jgi:hypothetical protein
MPLLGMSMKNIVIAVALAIGATGCASVSVTQPSQVTEKVGQLPELNSPANVTVGSTMFSQYRYWSKTGYRLLAPLSISLALGRIQTEANDFVVPSVAEGSAAYCTEKAAYIDPLVGPYRTACFLDNNGSGSFGIVKAAPGMVWFEKKLDPAIQYVQGELQVPRPDSKKYELLYQGISAKTLRLSYREYMNDFARPAFFQDVSYEITDFPAEITFRTVRISVLSADNNGIRYKILSGF